MSEEGYSTIRQHLDYLMGKRVVDVTQHTYEEFAETGEAYVMFLFEDGSWIKFPITEEGFDHQEG